MHWVYFVDSLDSIVLFVFVRLWYRHLVEEVRKLDQVSLGELKIAKGSTRQYRRNVDVGVKRRLNRLQTSVPALLSACAEGMNCDAVRMMNLHHSCRLELPARTRPFSLDSLRISRIMSSN
jgi:hypothetical protein